MSSESSVNHHRIFTKEIATSNYVNTLDVIYPSEFGINA